jgi:hypothetical protein
MKLMVEDEIRAAACVMPKHGSMFGMMMRWRDEVVQLRQALEDARPYVSRRASHRDTPSGKVLTRVTAAILGLPVDADAKTVEKAWRDRARLAGER